jgi:hypothetical protein
MRRHDWGLRTQWETLPSLTPSGKMQSPGLERHYLPFDFCIFKVDVLCVCITGRKSIIILDKI